MSDSPSNVAGAEKDVKERGEPVQQLDSIEPAPGSLEVGRDSHSRSPLWDFGVRRYILGRQRHDLDNLEEELNECKRRNAAWLKPKHSCFISEYGRFRHQRGDQVAEALVLLHVYGRKSSADAGRTILQVCSSRPLS